ncbi:nodulin MtN21/EamA-like transporter family protein [Abeliophyllum distichum]|uniref:Nodulin MtN21/EamA-like transporter family protein n=1 Tax=Abeliophyllum distichum TaxID=126358 RepID=A0ABD1PE60_9LAMI
MKFEKFLNIVHLFKQQTSGSRAAGSGLDSACSLVQQNGIGSACSPVQQISVVLKAAPALPPHNRSWSLLLVIPWDMLNESTRHAYLYQAFFIRLDPSRLEGKIKEEKKETKYGRQKLSEKMKLLVALLILQLCLAGFHIVSRVALNIGISKVVYPVYRNIIALLMLGPFSYFYEKKERPPLTFSLLVQFFLLALVGITANQGFYLLGLYYASSTFASAMQNLVPAITFIMASTFGCEQVNIMRKDGLAKILGTIASVGGATIITLYKGSLILHQSSQPVGTNLEQDTFFNSTNLQNWTWGCIFLLGHCLSWSGWMVLQAPILKKYPAKLSLTSFTCFFGLIQFLFIAAFVERDPKHWQIQSSEEIFTILYAGVLSSGIVLALQTWCIQKGGPVFIASFQPVQTVLVAGMAFVVLGDQLYSGGVIGAALIMVGLYLVLWGKTEEKRNQNQDKEETLTKHLLEDKNNDEESYNESQIP